VEQARTQRCALNSWKAWQTRSSVWADRIALVGAFNTWDAHAHLLRQTRDEAEWHVSLELEAVHSYCFRYLVNGEEWMDDDHADSYEPNAYGAFDSVVRT